MVLSLPIPDPNVMFDVGDSFAWLLPFSQGRSAFLVGGAGRGRGVGVVVVWVAGIVVVVV